MTEQEWLASTDPQAMLRYLQGDRRLIDFHPDNPSPISVDICVSSMASDRKLRLFACACCRQVWDEAMCGRCGGREGRWGRPTGAHDAVWIECSHCHGTGRVGELTDPRSRRAVEVAERYADGEADFASLYIAEQDAMSVWNGDPMDNPAGMARYCCIENTAYAAQQITRPNLRNVPPPATQAALLRDILGNPYRTTLGADSLVMDDLRYWNDGTVPRIAKGIYDDRAWHLMPQLHDALLDAGCDDEELIAHCRSGGPHVRGCWVIDLLLGKQ